MVSQKAKYNRLFVIQSATPDGVKLKAKMELDVNMITLPSVSLMMHWSLVLKWERPLRHGTTSLSAKNHFSVSSFILMVKLFMSDLILFQPYFDIYL